MRHALVALVLMVLAAIVAGKLKPNQKLAQLLPPVSLEQWVPMEFGDWRFEPATVMQVVNPQAQTLVDKLYAQVITRNYLNVRTGERIMLSIAYGEDQSDSLQVHKPEVCYAAQGFAVQKHQRGELVVDSGSIPVKRVLAVQGPRSEPITYWVSIGDRVARQDGISQKLLQLSYGLKGVIPDGALVRISSISTKENDAFDLHQQFARSMLAAMTADARRRLAGLQN